MKSIRTALLITVAAAPLHAEEQRALGAHLHGVTDVQIALEGRALEILVRAPGIDIVGFEHDAESDADRAAVAAAIALLSDAANVVRLDPAAGCTLHEVEAEQHSDHDEEHEEHSDHEDHEADAGHSEFEAHYHFECTTPDALQTIAFPYFDTFPNAEEIEAEFLTDAGVGAAELNRDAPKLSLP